MPDELWELLEPLDDLRSPGLQGDPVLRHHQGEHGEGEDLRGVGLQQTNELNGSHYR